MRGRDVLDAAGWVERTLGGAAGRDWSVPVAHLSWSVGQTVAHAAGAALWCGIDLAAAETELRTVRLDIDAAEPPAQLLRTIAGAARVTALVVDAAPAGARGYDPDGPADASGFAGMCCDELLVHGWDAARGLGTAIDPPTRLAGRVLARLFPWVTPEPDPWRALLWANGRIALPGKARLASWNWHVAPLEQWRE